MQFSEQGNELPQVFHLTLSENEMAALAMCILMGGGLLTTCKEDFVLGCRGLETETASSGFDTLAYKVAILTKKDA